MTENGPEGPVRIAALILAVLAAAGALAVDGDLEVTLLMASTVVCGLLCFDTSMEREARSFGPWALLSLAPAAKTVPTVWYELRSDSDLLFERYDHAGSLFFGACMFGAVALLARPSDRLGAATSRFDAAVVAGSATAGALAGASVAFLFDGGFGPVSAGRVFETPTWFVLSGLLAAAAIAASHVRTLSLGLTGVLLAACMTAGTLAASVAGRSVDNGWWAVLFAGLAASAFAGGSLGEQAVRDRRSNVAVVVAMIVGLVAAASAIAARSDRDAWAPGWALLGILSVAMFGLAVASKRLDGPEPVSVRPNGISVDKGEHAQRARASALQSLQLEPSDGAARPRAPVNGVFSASIATAHSPGNRTQPDAPQRPPRIQPASSATESASRPASLATEYSPQPVAPQPVASQPASRPEAPQPAAPPLSDASLVASAEAAAAVRTAPPVQRHSLAPLAQAHHFDPSTGLLSAAGLQHAISRAFDVQRQAGHVTMLMFMIRDLDQIERDHGRLASAAVTREVAERIGSLLPDGTGARFARSAYAVVFVGDRSNVAETTQWLARVLLQLRAPVEGGSLGDKIDVVAGMAQCYESEDAAQFVKRANLGLARAVHLPEPTLVAMP